MSITVSIVVYHQLNIMHMINTEEDLDRFLDKKRSVNQQRELLICKNNNQHVVHYYKDTKQKVCMVCG